MITVTTYITIAMIAPCTFYGAGDGYLGQYHAAWWAGQTPLGWPDMVDDVHMGVATADWTIPFGTHLRLTVVHLPKWAWDEYSGIVGRSVEVVVVDRMGRGEEGFDLWPAAARKLMGPDWQRIGKVYVRAEIVRRRNAEDEAGYFKTKACSKLQPAGQRSGLYPRIRRNLPPGAS